MMSMSTAVPLRAAIYARISNDPEGRERGVERQRQDCEVLAAKLGLTVVAVFVDNDVSASTRSKKPRPDYDDMMHRARQGEFSVILAYSNSRLTRRPLEVEELIKLREDHDVRIRTVMSGDDDLNTADGRLVARIKGNVDAAESERNSERTRRAKLQTLTDGGFNGGRRPYGFHADGVTVNDVEAAILRWATNDILEGRSLADICRELNRRRQFTSCGGRWMPQTLRAVLMRPRNAGLISTKTRTGGKVVVLGRAQWPVVVRREKWQDLVDLLTDPSRRTRDPDRSQRPLGAGIYQCAKPTGGRDGYGNLMTCGKTLYAKNGRPKPSEPSGRPVPIYICDRWHLTINQTQTDDLVRSFVLEKLDDPAVVAALRTPKPKTRAQRVERARLVARPQQFEADYTAGLIPGSVWKRATDEIDKEVAQLDADVAASSAIAFAIPVLNAEDPAGAFASANSRLQRAVVGALVKVEILPGRGAAGIWRPERIRLTTRPTATPTSAPTATLE